MFSVGAVFVFKVEAGLSHILLDLSQLACQMLSLFLKPLGILLFFCEASTGM